jgi:hypothetical protein
MAVLFALFRHHLRLSPRPHYQVVLSSYNFKFTFFLMALQSFFTVVFIAVVMVRPSSSPRCRRLNTRVFRAGCCSACCPSKPGCCLCCCGSRQRLRKWGIPLSALPETQPVTMQHFFRRVDLSPLSHAIERRQLAAVPGVCLHRRQCLTMPSRFPPFERRSLPPLPVLRPVVNHAVSATLCGQRRVDLHRSCPFTNTQPTALRLTPPSLSVPCSHCHPLTR